MDSKLSAKVNTLHAIVTQIEQQVQYESNTVSRHQARIRELEGQKAELLKAVGTIDRAVQVVSQNGIGKIEGIVTDGLRRIFGNDQLGLVVEKTEGKRGNSYRLLIRDGETVGNAMESFGGGVQNVAAFLLRLIMLRRFKLARCLVLDEQFSNVSSEFLPQVSEMLRLLAHDFGFTILAVSHQDLLTSFADSIYEVMPGMTGPKLVRRDRPSSQQSSAQASGGDSQPGS